MKLLTLRPQGQLKRIPRGFHQIALQIRCCRRPNVNVVCFRGPGFLPTRFRRLIKRQVREFPPFRRQRFFAGSVLIQLL